MKVAITGGGGFIGRKLAARIANTGRLGDREVSGLRLYDVVAPEAPPDAGFPVDLMTGDLPSPGGRGAWRTCTLLPRWGLPGRVESWEIECFPP